MSSETPAASLFPLVVLDLFKRGNDWSATSVRWSPNSKATQRLRVHWQARDCVQGQISIAGGAVCLDDPTNYDRLVQQVDSLEKERDRLYWVDTFGDAKTMLVAVLPPGWSLAVPNAGESNPVDIKRYRDRIAAFWIVEPEGIAYWRVAPMLSVRQRDVPARLNAVVDEVQSASVPDQDSASVASALVVDQ
jgi:hypothetical protein